MRCRNCGWPNKPSERYCVKCHSPLEAEEDSSYSGTSFDNSGYSQSDSPLKKTVMETDVFGSGAKSSNYLDSDEPSGNNDMKQCPKCGYPLRPGVDKCPHCKFSIGQTIPEQKNESQATQREEEPVEHNRPTRMKGDTGNIKVSSDKPRYRGTTVNPYMMNMELEPSFILKPLKKFNERHELEEREFEGDSVILNRSNTDEKNGSITSKEQAVVSHKDGKWYIEDKSEQKTTFVQASHQIELQDGDIILLGNRLFEFHT